MGIILKPLLLTIFLMPAMAVFLNVSLSDDSFKKVEPIASKLEAFARLPDSNTLMKQEIGRLQSSDSLAVFSIIILENFHTEGKMQMTGILVDLENENSTDQVYIHAEELAEYKQTVGRMEEAIYRYHFESQSGHRTQGTEVCWRPNPVMHVLCTSYVMKPEEDALVLSAFKNQNFRFPGASPSELIDVVARGMEALGVEDVVPNPGPIDLPEDELEQMIASSLDHFPELLASEGVKAAGYNRRYDNRSAWVIFEPYEFSKSMAHTLSVQCERVMKQDDSESGWLCEHSHPRSYMTLDGQDHKIVIPGSYDLESALSLISYAKSLVGNSIFAEIKSWTVIKIHPRKNEVYITLRSEGEKELSYYLAELKTGQYELLGQACWGHSSCDGMYN